MALIQGTNSYVTLDEADDYFEDRLDGDNWDNLGDDSERALVTATRILEALFWKGSVATDEQVLSFPRSSLWNRNRGTYFDNTVIPEFIKEAQYELAFYLAENKVAITGEQVRDTTTVGSLTVQTVPLPKLPTTVRRLITPYLAGSAVGLERAS